jgi:hypothetical protein
MSKLSEIATRHICVVDLFQEMCLFCYTINTQLVNSRFFSIQCSIHCSVLKQGFNAAAWFIFPYTHTQDYHQKLTPHSIWSFHTSLPRTGKLEVYNTPAAQAIFIEKQVLATIFWTLINIKISVTFLLRVFCTVSNCASYLSTVIWICTLLEI